MLAFKIFSKVFFALVILKIQCKSKKIYLDKEDLNVRLTGHVFWARDKMEDLPTCARRCIEYKKCKSINFSIKYKICELNLVKKLPENQCELERNASFINMDIDIWPKVGTDPCFDRPCTEDERCIKNGGSYLCSKIASPTSPTLGPTTTSTEAPMTSCPITSSSAAAPITPPPTTTMGQTTSSTGVATTTSARDASTVWCGEISFRPFRYEGCYKYRTSSQGPALTGHEFTNDQMTISMCGDFCCHMGYVWFGLERQKNCICDSDFDSIGSSNDCTHPCGGDQSETCGGYWQSTAV